MNVDTLLFEDREQAQITIEKSFIFPQRVDISIFSALRLGKDIVVC